MARNLLAIVKAAADEMGLPPVTVVVGSTDRQVVQMQALVNRTGNELAQIEGGWTALRGEQLITWIAGTANYAFPSDFAYYVQDTFWDRSSKWPLSGPLNAVDWQLLKSGQYLGGVFPRYRIMNGQITFDPTPTSTDTVAIEYISLNWCSNAAGSVKAASMTADTDVPLIPDDLLVLGLKWRLLSAKGFPYDDEREAYETALARLHPRDSVTQDIQMRGRPTWAALANLGPQPIVTVP